MKPAKSIHTRSTPETMSQKDDEKAGKPHRFSDSNELFESIFRNELNVAGQGEKKGEEKPRRPERKPPNAAALAKRRPPPHPPGPSKQPLPTPGPAKREKAEKKPVAAPAVRSRSKKPALKIAVMAGLLLILSGVLWTYSGTPNFSAILNMLGFSKPETAPAPQTEIPRALPEKPATVPHRQPVDPTPPSGDAKVASPGPILPEASSGIATELKSFEKPAVPKEEGVPPGPAPAPERPLETNAREGASPKGAHAVEAVRNGTRSSSAENTTVAKDRNGEPFFSPLPASRYPYSIYLGSYKNDQRLGRAISIYQDKGLALYWVNVDLGEKGVWFRLYAGFFPTRKAAEDYINANRIQDAEARQTQYAIFLGGFQSREALDGKMEKLSALGFCPYAIKQAPGRTLLFSGAFNRKDLAEKEKEAFVAKGIRAEVIER